MGMPRFSMPPPMCMRQLLSQAARASAPVAEAKSSLSFSIAPEISGYFTEKVPPKPQQTSDCSHFDQFNAGERVQQGARLG